ncbi:MAG: YkgJ family cysteine cluster protein [Bacillota bacterium]
MKKQDRDSCIQCGTCCKKGGPTLHHEDKAILLAGHLGYQHLVTIRKGELAFDPILESLKPVEKEMVKVRGTENGWACCFYNENESACIIYANRFLECRLLKCWDPSEIISVIGKDTIVRADIVNPDDPIMQVVETHERECSLEEVENLIKSLSSEPGRTDTMAKLKRLICTDLTFRYYAASELGLRKEFEPFVFGRPLTQILKSRGIKINPSTSSIEGCPPELESFLKTAFKPL